MGFLEEDMSGTLFGVRALNSNWDEPFFGNITLDSTQDVLVAQVGHLALGNEERTFLLKVFLNYEEVGFRPVGADSYKTELLISVPAGFEAHIPFTLGFELPEPDYTHALTVAVFENTHLHFADFSQEDAEELWMNGIGAMALNFDVTYGVGGQINLTANYTEPLSRHENMQFHNLQINQNFDDFSTVSGSDGIHSSHIEVRRGEMVELAWWANPYHSEDVFDRDSYVVVGLLDWQQVEMNGEPYLLVNTEDAYRMVDHGVFTFEAPNEVGMYEFIAFIVPNPTQALHEYTFFPLEFSWRFTIEVVE